MTYFYKLQDATFKVPSLFFELLMPYFRGDTRAGGQGGDHTYYLVFKEQLLLQSDQNILLHFLITSGSQTFGCSRTSNKMLEAF